MLNKTHLAVGGLFMLIFLPSVVHKWVYFGVFLVATLLPNLDVILSGRKYLILKPMRLFFKKRGFLHSFTFCLVITILLAWFWPILAFPFFLGYGIHLLLDSWTVEGIMPFWPLRAVSKGRVTTGGGFEHILFYLAIVADVIAAYGVLF